MLFGVANPFSTEGQWYKGNLHTHTTNSEESYHIVVVGLKEAVELPEEASVQEVIDIIRSQQGIIFLGHPYWSGLTLNDVLPLKEILGIEVFNTRCHRDIGKGFSAVHWDDLLAHGKNLYGFAVDDTHFQEDIGQGWIMVKAKSLSAIDILSAIEKGQFYSSCGPIIKDIIFEDNAITVTCSEAIAINFICDGSHGASFLSDGGNLLASANYNLSVQERYLRVEVIDAQGKASWIQPLFYREIKTR